MCIICAAAKKRFMHREEVLESMRVNPAGFFMAALKPDGTRKTIRTLNDKEAIGFFDEMVKEDDTFVMHARIPSRGAKNIDNVHGWESDGILFMHNMTITDIDDMMKRVKWENTDSEFFFRKIFIPYYRGLGGEAYKDGKFHPDLDNIVQHFVGYSNKFCFIMPDNKVIRYGNWVSEPDRKLEDGTVAFYASNGGYKVYNLNSKAGRGGTAAGAAGFRGQIGFGAQQLSCQDYNDLYGYDYEDEYAFDSYGATEPWRNRKRKMRKTATTAAKTSQVNKGEMLLKLAGVKGVCQLAITHLVLENTIDCRFIYSEDETEEKIQKVLREYLPACCAGTFKAVQTAFKDLADSEGCGFSVAAVNTYVEEFAKTIAAIYEEKMYKEKSPYAVTPSEWAVKLGLEATIERMNIIMRMNNVSIDFKNSEPQEFVKAYVMAGDGSEFDEVYIDDILGLSDMKADEMQDAIQMLLSFINDCVDTFFPYDVVTEIPIASDKPEATAVAEGKKEGDSDDTNEIEDSAKELTADDETADGSEEVDDEDTGLAGIKAYHNDDQDSPLGAA